MRYIKRLLFVVGCGVFCYVFITAKIETDQLHRYNKCRKCLEMLSNEITITEDNINAVEGIQSIISVLSEEKILGLCSDVKMKAKWLKGGICVRQGTLILFAVPNPSGTMSINWRDKVPLFEQSILENTYSPTNGLLSFGDITSYKLGNDLGSLPVESSEQR